MHHRVVVRVVNSQCDIIKKKKMFSRGPGGKICVNVHVFFFFGISFILWIKRGRKCSNHASNRIIISLLRLMEACKIPPAVTGMTRSGSDRKCATVSCLKTGRETEYTVVVYATKVQKSLWLWIASDARRQSRTQSMCEMLSQTLVCFIELFAQIAPTLRILP